jgi:NAD(P)H-hydrate repair Nnr-like enzyme with NAD(P)H-hydrate dehydratase domain
VNYKDNLKEMASSESEAMVLTAVGGSAVNRMASRIAFQEKKLSLTSPDIIKVLYKVFDEYYKL